MPKRIELVYFDAGEVSVDPRIEAAEGLERTAPRRFSMTAYRGGQLRLPNYKFPLVVRLSGIDFGDQVKPVLIDHKKDAEHVLGQTDRIIVANNALMAEGVVMGNSETARNVIELNDKGYLWQSSIGALPKPQSLVLVPAGVPFTENGQQFVGPCYVSTKTKLGEISFVVKGADETSAARIAASAAEDIMSFEEFVASLGFDPATLSDAQKASMTTLYQQSQQQTPPPAEGAGGPPPADDPNKPKPGQQPPPANASAGDMTITAEDQRELNRINAIASVCHGALGEHPEIEAQAIEEGWDMRRTRLQVVRARRPQVPNIHIRHNTRDPQVIEASLAFASGIDPNAALERGWYTEQQIEAAESPHWRNMGFCRLGHEIVAAAGGHLRPGRLDTEGVRYIFAADQKLNGPEQFMIEAAGGGMSTLSLGGALGNVASKILLNTWLEVPTIVPDISVKQSPTDYKPFKAFQITMTGELKEIAPDGNLPDVGLTEEEFANQVKLMGAYISVSEVHFVNDDLGVFAGIPKMFARKAAISREKAAIKTLLAAGFYSTGNGNYMEGSDTALSIEALTKASEYCDVQTDSENEPIMLPFTRILVPPALKVPAGDLYKEKNIVMAGGNTLVTKTANNPHVGSFEPLSSPWLAEKFGLANSSDDAWYLLPPKGDMAPLQAAYLNGQESPTVEKGEVDFRKLGIAWRISYRLGFAPGNKRAIFKSLGKASG